MKHTDKPSKYSTNDGLDFLGITFSTPLDQIIKVKKQNNLVINVFGWKGRETIIHRVSDIKDPEIRRINVILIADENNSHHCYIKSLIRLLHCHYRTGKKVHFCKRCLQGFSSEKVLTDHTFYCWGIKGRAIRIEMPKDGENILHFENYQKQMKASYIIYADFESIITKLH